MKRYLPWTILTALLILLPLKRLLGHRSRYLTGY